MARIIMWWVLDKGVQGMQLHTAQIYNITMTLQRTKCCNLEIATTFCSIQKIVLVWVSKLFSENIFQSEHKVKFIGQEVAKTATNLSYYSQTTAISSIRRSVI